ncbi:MAG TPA: ATP-binding protein [Acidimicrobiales bacterium]|nr:ATP-binding protein [Acidimicrobiales bacterium]
MKDELRPAGRSPAPSPHHTGHAGPRLVRNPYVFPRAARLAGWVAIVVVLAAAAWATRSVDGERPHLTGWVLSGIAFAVPGLPLTWWAGSRVDPVDRPVWRLWFAGYVIALLGAAGLLAVGAQDWTWARGIWLASVGVSILAFGAGNTLMMRSRAGRRATAPDILDLISVMLAVTAPVALVVGEAVVTSDDAWFVVSWSIITVALVHGVASAAVFTARIRPEDRVPAWLGVALACLGIVEAAGQVALGLTGFRAPSAPLLTLHALACGVGLAFVLHAPRHPSMGRDGLHPRTQVRRSGVVSVLVLVSAVVILAEAGWWRGTDWVLLCGTVSAGLLLILSSVRHLLVARETTRLYEEVAAAADERRQLLSDVLVHVDADQHRVAARLHQQAMSSYSTVASIVTALELSPQSGPAAALALVATRARADLAAQVDSLRDVLAAVRPPDGGGQRLVAPLRAYVDRLYQDGSRPELAVDVDPGVMPDWTTELMALRIAQAALDNVRRHAACTRIGITVALEGQDLVIEIGDDGVGFEPDQVAEGAGLATMRTLAGFLGGRVEVCSGPGEGTQVRAVLGREVDRGERPRLRVVPDR